MNLPFSGDDVRKMHQITVNCATFELGTPYDAKRVALALAIAPVVAVVSLVPGTRLTRTTQHTHPNK